jgi:hypothetical protein
MWPLIWRHYINGDDYVEAGLVTACQTWTQTGFY